MGVIFDLFVEWIWLGFLEKIFRWNKFIVFVIIGVVLSLPLYVMLT
jgi:hypothetical protein